MTSTIVSMVILGITMAIYLNKHKSTSRKTDKKITKAKEYGFHEPVSLHPLIDQSKCIGSGACVKACPEKDILGLSRGKGKLVNASHCVGHGACAAACPVGAITLVFGTETRGVEIPYVSPEFETNVSGVYIAGELGGMGLIKNAMTQGREAVEYIASSLKGKKTGRNDIYDLIIVGAGPAGLAASLAAMNHNFNFLTIEQDNIGGTVYHYPRHKIVMTSPVEIPMYGKVKLRETTKEALLDLWMSIIKKTGLTINCGEKLMSLTPSDDGTFIIKTSQGEYKTAKVLLAIGRRGTPRKLGVPGEELPKVAYRLLDAEQHGGDKLLVVGGGDSAVEAAMALSDNRENEVTLSYRGEAFSRIKPKNRERLDAAIEAGKIQVLLQSNVKEITPHQAILSTKGGEKIMDNDFIYIFAGGELPNEFLKSIGIRIEKKFGTA